MAEFLTTSRARTIFCGGSVVFVVVVVAMTVHSHRCVLQTSTAGTALSEALVHRKHVWEERSCINCHTLHGEGAYFAPELGNVMTRRGVRDDPEGAFQILRGWIEGRRQMPAYDMTDEHLRGLAEFLRRADQTDTQGWPPADAG